MNNVRIEIQLPQEEVDQLDKLAKASNRSRKNFCETALLQVIQKQDKRGHPYPSVNAPAIEYAMWGDKPVLILKRKIGSTETMKCPFCGQKHTHGWAEGHRVAHCDSPGGGSKTHKTITAPDGTELNQDDGYILRNV